MSGGERVLEAEEHAGVDNRRAAHGAVHMRAGVAEVEHADFGDRRHRKWRGSLAPGGSSRRARASAGTSAAGQGILDRRSRRRRACRERDWQPLPCGRSLTVSGPMRIAEERSTEPPFMARTNAWGRSSERRASSSMTCSACEPALRGANLDRDAVALKALSRIARQGGDGLRVTNDEPGAGGGEKHGNPEAHRKSFFREGCRSKRVLQSGVGGPLAAHQQINEQADHNPRSAQQLGVAAEIEPDERADRRCQPPEWPPAEILSRASGICSG